LYVGAEMEEKDIWANITDTCHCINDDQDQIIFHDNDFEVFIDVDGSNHNYKEFEINAANQTWILLLNKPYTDGGYENSSRVYGPDGFDMQPPLTCGVNIDPEDALNNPGVSGNFWTAEIALPIEKIMERSLDPSKRPVDGDYWRINFSRVEWRVIVEDDIYVKDPEYPHEDNWVWSPQGEVAMHLPERWGFLQFSEEAPGSTDPVVQSEEWTLRQVAMALYYAEHNFASHHGGMFTDDLETLSQYVNYPQQDIDQDIFSACTDLPLIELSNQRTNFVATMYSFSFPTFTVKITDDRLLTINYDDELPKIEIF